MKSKFLKKCLCVIISAVLVVACMPSAFAVLSPKEDESYHTPGGFFVTLSPEAPMLEELLAGYEIECADLIKTTVSREGYYEICSAVSSENESVSEGDIVMLKYHIWLVDETEEMLKEVVAMLLSNPCVFGAVVNNYKPTEPVTTVPATDSEDVTEATAPVTTTPAPTIPVVVEPTAPETSEGAKYHPGRVLVSVTYGAPSLAEMLEGFEITNTRLLTPGSANQIVYLVEFSEKTYEIVWETIEVLSENPYVIVAEPDYIGEWCVELVTTVPATDSDTTPATSEAEKINDNDLSVPSLSDTVGEYQPVVLPVKGDANGDGELTVKDATCIQKYLAGLALAETQGEYTACNITSDYDGDGQVTIKDATAIQKKVAEII